MQEDQARILRTGNREHSSDESSVSVARGCVGGRTRPHVLPRPPDRQEANVSIWEKN